MNARRALVTRVGYGLWNFVYCIAGNPVHNPRSVSMLLAWDYFVAKNIVFVQVCALKIIHFESIKTCATYFYTAIMDLNFYFFFHVSSNCIVGAENEEKNRKLQGDKFVFSDHECRCPHSSNFKNFNLIYERTKTRIIIRIICW